LQTRRGQGMSGSFWVIAGRIRKLTLAGDVRRGLKQLL
jgi:hypothetical protein